MTLERRYDATLPYRFVKYGRMSDRHQNKRSPDQQFNTIDETIVRFGYPWMCIDTYRDDGISGQYLRKRLEFQRLLRNIEAQLIQIDLIVVDTLERLGRAEEISELRRKLYVDYGILIVAADNGFCDPTGVVGKAVGMVEQIRSTENTRISRHNVIRGKKDAARRGRWPGGPPPFGLKLKPIVDDSVSPPEFYNKLELEPREAAALRRAFEHAAVTGHGDQRLAKWWNTNPEIPDDFKPVSPFTIGYRLTNRIYVGELVWGANRTGIVNDTRVIEKNPDGAEVIADFCPALVSQEQFQRIHELRQARSEQIRRSRETPIDDTPKLIAPQARGLTLKYLLSGLLRCGHCRACLRTVPSGRRSKEGKRYVYYTCPRHYDGACNNSRHFPEDQLREATGTLLRSRLFPVPEQTDGVPDWLPELLQLVEQELKRFRESEPDCSAADQDELRQLEQKRLGWTLSLGNPALNAQVRAEIEAQFAQATQRQQELEQAMAADKARQSHLERTLDAKELIRQLQRLDQVLAGSNPTLANLELSKHIDSIHCFLDGRVELRGTCIGLFEGAVELLSRDRIGVATSATGDNKFSPVQPRRRGRLRIPNLSAKSQATVGDSDTALDPDRFLGLPEVFFWEESFVIMEKKSWSEEYASAVAAMRATGQTHEQLAAFFGVTTPTIRKALCIAAMTDEALQKLPKKMPRARWQEQHFRKVAELRRQGYSMADLCRHFGRSEPLIRAALKLAEQDVQQNGSQLPDVLNPPDNPTSG